MYSVLNDTFHEHSDRTRVWQHEWMDSMDNEECQFIVIFH